MWRRMGTGTGTGPTMVQYARMYDYVSPLSMFVPLHLLDESSQEGAGCSRLMKKDVNGNPVGGLDAETYRQMRAPPPSSHAYSTPSRGGSASKNNDSEMGNKSDDASSPPGASANGASISKRKRKAAKTPGRDVNPKEEPHYVGELDVDLDTLVNYVDNRVSEKTLRKLGKKDAGGGNGTAALLNNTTTTTTTAPPSSKSAVKKERKTKQTGGVGEDHADGSLAPASETTQLLSAATSNYSSISSDSASKEEGEEDKEEGVDAQGVREMGSNQSTTPQLEIDPKNHRVPEKQVKSPPKPAADTKSDVVQNHKNHVVSSAKSPPAAKKEPPVLGGGGGDSKGKAGKGGPKEKNDQAGIENAVPASDSFTPNNNKKAKSKPAKIESSKPENSSQKKSGEGEDRKEGKGDANKDSVKVKAKPEVSSPPPTTPVTSDMQPEVNGDDFRFTDFDSFSPFKEEADFQTVKSKKSAKKKTEQQPRSTPQAAWREKQTSAQPSPTGVSYARAGGGERVDRGGNGGRPQQQHQQQRVADAPASSHRNNPPKARSFTPPPSSRGPSSEEASFAASLKDADPLSPSAFPGLPTHNRQRRRSLEDLDTVQDKDSDKESCHSLPADKNLRSRAAGTWVAGNRQALPISYAVVASSAKSPRQSVDSSKAESVASSTDDNQDFPSPTSATSPMKWKGAPKERRHSIGSAPEDLAKASSAGSGLQRSGSQELLPRDSNVDADKVLVAMTPSDSAGSFAGSDADSARGSEAGSEAPSDVFPALPSAGSEERKGVLGASVEERKAKAQAAPASKPTIPVVSSSSNLTSSAKSAVAPAVVFEGAAARPVSASSRTVPQRGGPPNPATARSQPTATKVTTSSRTDGPVKPANNGLKGTKKGVVEFLDSKKDTVPLEPISFFFNPSASVAIADSRTEVMPAQNAASPNVDSAAAPASVPAKDLVAANKSVGVSATAAAPTSSVTTRAAVKTSPPPTSSTTTNDTASSTKPQKGPHIAGLNGVVQVQQQQVRSDPRAQPSPRGAAPTVPPPRSASSSPAHATAPNSNVAAPVSNVAAPVGNVASPVSNVAAPVTNVAAPVGGSPPAAPTAEPPAAAEPALPNNATRRIVFGSKVQRDGFTPFAIHFRVPELEPPVPTDERETYKAVCAFLAGTFKSEEYLQM